MAINSLFNTFLRNTFTFLVGIPTETILSSVADAGGRTARLRRLLAETTPGQQGEWLGNFTAINPLWPRWTN